MPRKPGQKRYPYSTFYDYVDRDGYPRKGKGRTYLIGGEEVDLFPSSVLVAVLHRRLRTLYKWELNFGFPRALYSVEGDKLTCRWYSRKQINAIVKVYDRLGRLRGENREKLSLFVSTVKRLFFLVDAPEQAKDAIIAAQKGT